MDEKEVRHRPRLNSELAERHLLLEELFLDEPTKIPSVLSFFLSFFIFTSSVEQKIKQNQFPSWGYIGTTGV